MQIEREQRAKRSRRKLANKTNVTCPKCKSELAYRYLTCRQRAEYVTRCPECEYKAVETNG